MSTSDNGKVAELIARKSIGESAGFTLRKVGGVVICGGNLRITAEMACCTSCDAASMSRSSLNWMVIEVLPRTLDEVIESMPAMVESCASRGVATADAMVSGSAPGRLADTTMVGKSTLGSSLTGSVKYPNTPKITSAAITSVVITGRRMKGAEIFMD